MSFLAPAKAQDRSIEVFRRVSAAVSEVLRAADFEFRVVLFAGYVLTTRATLELNHFSGHSSMFWIPTGIAVAGFLLRGRSIWPVIFSAAFLVDALSTGSVGGSIVLALGQTLGAAAIAHLTTRWSVERVFLFAPSDVLRFALIAVPTGAAISATIGTVTFLQMGYVSHAEFVDAWARWWQGDAVGAIVAAPLIVLLFVHDSHAFHLREAFYLLSLMLSLLFVCMVVFCPTIFFNGDGSRFLFVIAPLMAWIAVRYCPMETAVANAVVSGFTVWNSVRGSGPFSSSEASLHVASIFVAVVCVTSLTLSAAVMQKRLEEEQLLISHYLQAEASRLDIDRLSDQLECLRTVSEEGFSLLERILARIPEAVRVIDLKERSTTYLSPGCDAVFGRRNSERYSDLDWWLASVHPEDRARVASVLARCAPGTPDYFEFEYRVKRADGSVSWLLDRGVFVGGGRGGSLRLVLVTSGSRKVIRDGSELQASGDASSSARKAAGSS